MSRAPDSASEASSAREIVLARARAALRDIGDAEPPPVERDYRRSDDSATADRLDLLAERLDEYRATVHRCAPDRVAATVAEVCAGHGARRLIVPADLPDAWRPDATGVGFGDDTDHAGADARGGSDVELELVADTGQSAAELDRFDGVLTGSAVAIAETGTIVLDSGPTQGRRALTLVPDLHVCVVDAGQVVMLVPEAVDRLASAAAEGRPLTFVSGPSATSDIELSRVEGVHGPRRLHVVLVADPAN